MSDMKQAQEVAKHKAPKRTSPKLVAYPNYNKSLVTQRHKSPVGTGLSRGLQTGTVGAVLGAVIARMLSNKPTTIAGGALAGGALGAVPGFVSGKNEAESDNSRLLFLRRRMGINEPGELDALLQHPEVSASMIQKTAAMTPGQVEVLKRVIGGLVGTAAGAGWGYGISPHVSGYADVDSARRLSGFAGMATGAMIGALAGGSGAKTLAWMKRNPKEMLAIPGGLVAGELAPSAVAMMSRQSKATRDLADATNALSVPSAIRSLAGSKITQGAGVGAGLAGLAAITTGLRRARTDEEIKKDKSRTGMVTGDFLKYLVPAMVGGGVVGSMAKRNT